MFEPPEDKEESRGKQVWIIAAVIVALVVVVTLVYVVSRPRPKTPVRAQSPASARQTTPPDPVHDLQVVRAVMGKDVSGVRVMWSVQLRNKSAVYTYTDIQYEASLIGPTGRVLSVNRDTIKDTIGPREEKKVPPFIDGIYDAGASTFQFVLTGAKATGQ